MKNLKTLFLGLAIALMPISAQANWLSDTLTSIGTSIWNHLPQTFKNSPTLQNWACRLGIGTACYITAHLIVKTYYEDQGDDQAGETRKLPPTLKAMQPIIQKKEQLQTLPKS
jgi:hypothetical protein